MKSFLREFYPTSLTEIATALIRLHGIHEGHWRVQFKFAISAANVEWEGIGHTVAPFTPITGLTLIRLSEPTPYTVDATQVNPKVADAVTPATTVVG